jgi:hypothetical protein
MAIAVVTSLRRKLQEHEVLSFVIVIFLAQASLAWLASRGTIRTGYSEWSFLLKPAIAFSFAWLLGGFASVLGMIPPLARFRVGARWYLFALVVFPLILLASVYLHRLGTGRLDEEVVIDLWAIREPQLGLYLVICAISFADEVAFFGYSYTRLVKKYSAITSCVLVALAWSLSYSPRIFMQSGMMADATIPQSLFTANFLALTPICAWVYNSTKSALLVILMQVTTNLGILAIPVLPQDAGSTAPFEIKIVLMALLSAYLVFRFGSKYLTVDDRVAQVGS